MLSTSPGTSMSFLVPTLHTLLTQADAYFDDGRLRQARQAYEDLVQVAQEKPDRATEVMARSMLVRCLLRVRDLEGAREQLAGAARLVDPQHLDAHARYRAALARVAIEEGPPEVTRRELQAYLTWAEDVRRGDELIDACLLLADTSELEDRVEWLRRGIDQAELLEATGRLGRAWTALAGALDQLEQTQQALEAYQSALRWYRDHGGGRELVATAWAVGALACRLEEWPLGRTVLEHALELAEPREDCDDLVALVLADLARVYEAAGDVIEARHILLRALQAAREQQLSELWPERWASLRADARRLELE
jgi:tetratricopeptide (TPR) repeat protein